MRTLLLAASFAAVSVCAQAADLPLHALKAAPQPPVYDPYSGFYLGGAVGYGWDRGNLGAGLPNGPADFGDLSNAPQGFLGGVYAGLGTRIPGLLAGFGLDGYLGAEAAGYLGNLSGTAATPGMIITDRGTAGIVATTNDRWLASAMARFGLIYQNVMFYGQAGWGWGGTALAVMTGQVPTTTLGNNSKTESGFAWGAGIEFPWFFGPRWKARVEYKQFDFGTNVADLITVPAITATQKNRVDALLFGVNLAIGP